MPDILILFNNSGVSGAVNEYLPHDWVRLHIGRNVGDSARSVALNSRWIRIAEIFGENLSSV